MGIVTTSACGGVRGTTGLPAFPVIDRVPAMDRPVAHLCYSGLSGATTVALNIAGGSSAASRHAFVLLGRCEVHPSQAEQLSTMGCRWRAVRKRSRWDIGCYRRAARALVELGPAAVVFHGVRTLPVMWWVGRLAPGMRRVVMVHTAPELLGSWRWRHAAGWVMGVADASVAVSEAQRHWLATTAPTATSAERLVCIPNGLDVEFWRGNVKPPGHRPVKLTMVGSLVRSKGQATLLHALAKLGRDRRDVTLTLAGDGPARGELQVLAERLGVDGCVTFAGALPPARVRELLEQTDLYVHASPAESFGLSAAEAMLAGRCVVAVASAGMRELLDDGGAGWLAPPDDPAALGQRITEAIDHPAESGRRAIAGQEKAMQEFDRRRMSRAMEALIDERPA